MQRLPAGRALGAFCLLLLVLGPGGRVMAQDAAKQAERLSGQALGDLSSFRTLAADTLAIVNTGNLARAKTRIKSLETNWDKAEAALRPRNPEQWRMIDKAIDAALAQLRADAPQAAASEEALQKLLAILDRPNQDPPASQEKSAAVEAARLSVIDIIAVAERLQVGASVLDVSFEPADGRPIYAVRTYANGKVWDGLLDGASGAAIGQGIMMDESALDAEDKAELAALKDARVTLREAIASAEKVHGGRAFNAGLEQVRGRAVWEILVQNAAQPHQVHVDPVTGKIL
jgi:uncharacterized membrane protein YkoI